MTSLKLAVALQIPQLLASLFRNLTDCFAETVTVTKEMLKPMKLQEFFLTVFYHSSILRIAQ